MATRHPFDWLSASGQKRAFVALLALTLAVAVIAAAQQVWHPVARYIKRYVVGQRRPGWMQRQK